MIVISSQYHAGIFDGIHCDISSYTIAVCSISNACISPRSKRLTKGLVVSIYLPLKAILVRFFVSLDAK